MHVHDAFCAVLFGKQCNCSVELMDLSATTSVAEGPAKPEQNLPAVEPKAEPSKSLSPSSPQAPGAVDLREAIAKVCRLEHFQGDDLSKIWKWEELVPAHRERWLALADRILALRPVPAPEATGVKAYREWTHETLVAEVESLEAEAVKRKAAILQEAQKAAKYQEILARCGDAVGVTDWETPGVLEAKLRAPAPAGVVEALRSILEAARGFERSWFLVGNITGAMLQDALAGALAALQPVPQEGPRVCPKCKANDVGNARYCYFCDTDLKAPLHQGSPPEVASAPAPRKVACPYTDHGKDGRPCPVCFGRGWILVVPAADSDPTLEPPGEVASGPGREGDHG